MEDYHKRGGSTRKRCSWPDISARRTIPTGLPSSFESRFQLTQCLGAFTAQTQRTAWPGMQGIS